MRLRLSQDELGTAALLLYFGNLGYIPILMPNTGGALTAHGQAEQMHSINHIVLILVWTAILAFIIKCRFKLAVETFSAKVAFAYCAVLTLPILIAKDAGASITFAVSFTISTIYALSLVRRYQAQRLAVIVGWVLFVLAAASALFAVLLPRYGLDHINKGAWQGVTEQKNSLGLIVALGTAVALSLKADNLAQRTWKWVFIATCLLDAGFSQSREAWVTCIVLFTVHLYLRVHSLFSSRSRAPVLVLSSSIAVLGAGLIISNWVVLLKSLGRDATLSGRTELWSAVWQECQRHLLIGHAGNPFWGTPAAGIIYGRVGWIPTSAHNGFLECLLDFGVLGLMPLVLLFASAIWAATKVLSHIMNYQPYTTWMYCIVVITTFNCVQATTGFPNSISWLLLVGSACILEHRASTAVPHTVRTYGQQARLRIQAS